MPTKPEGPAQEQCPHCRLFGIHAMSCQYDQFTATPAPSQPAGAREWLQDKGVGVVYRHIYGGERVEYSPVDIAALLTAYAAQQTAAKDAALVAAERERDSLREQLRAAEEAFDRMATCEDDESEEFVTAWDALGAALKAGKDGQQ